MVGTSRRVPRLAAATGRFKAGAPPGDREPALAAARGPARAPLEAVAGRSSAGPSLRGSSSAMARSLSSPRVSTWRIRSRVRFMMAPTSSSVMPPRSATSSAQVFSSSQTSWSGKLSLMDPVDGFTSR